MVVPDAFGGVLGPRAAYDVYTREIFLLRLAEKNHTDATGDHASPFFQMTLQEYLDALRALQDEIANLAYFAIVAATEGLLQRDFRARAAGRARVLMYRVALHKTRQERKKGLRVNLDDILDSWRSVSLIQQQPISNFKQLLDHRHWLAHGRYFRPMGPLAIDPDIAHQRANALIAELHRCDPGFPRG